MQHLLQIMFSKIKGDRMRKRNEEIYNKIIEYINQYYNKFAISPSLAEIAEYLGVDKSTISRYLAEMRQKGLVDSGRNHRCLTTEYTQKYKNVIAVPFVGTIACGTPILARENIESELFISSAMLGEGEFFGLRAEGDSMINAGIANGDYVIARKQNIADEGQIIVALIDDSATLKRFYIDKKNKKIRLHPENDELDDMYFDSVEIQGVVKKIIKNCD